MNLKFWLSHPSQISDRIKYWFWEKLNPEKPWMCPGTVRFCEQRLHKSMSALEFGSGRSTFWFAQKVGHLTSIEHQPDWYKRTNAQLTQAQIKNVDYRLVELNHPESQPEQAEYSPLPDYVGITHQFPDQSLDFVVVDGHYRTNCVRQVIPKIAAGGYLLVDDTNLWPSIQSLGIPEHWQIVDDSSNGLKRCVIWQAV